MPKSVTIVICLMTLGLIGLFVFVIGTDHDIRERAITRATECESKHGTYFYRDDLCLNVSSIPLENK